MPWAIPISAFQADGSPLPIYVQLVAAGGGAGDGNICKNFQENEYPNLLLYGKSFPKK